MPGNNNVGATPCGCPVSAASFGISGRLIPGNDNVGATPCGCPVLAASFGQIRESSGQARGPAPTMIIPSCPQTTTAKRNHSPRQRQRRGNPLWLPCLDGIIWAGTGACPYDDRQFRAIPNSGERRPISQKSVAVQFRNQ